MVDILIGEDGTAGMPVLHPYGGLTMADFISREAAIRSAFKLCRNTDYPFIDDIQNAIEEIPAADVRPVVYGSWKPNPRNPYWLDCTVCGYGKPEKTVYNFCPNCGANMIKYNGDYKKEIKE